MRTVLHKVYYSIEKCITEALNTKKLPYQTIEMRLDIQSARPSKSYHSYFAVECNIFLAVVMPDINVGPAHLGLNQYRH